MKPRSTNAGRPAGGKAIMNGKQDAKKCVHYDAEEFLCTLCVDQRGAYYECVLLSDDTCLAHNTGNCQA